MYNLRVPEEVFSKMAKVAADYDISINSLIKIAINNLLKDGGVPLDKDTSGKETAYGS